MSDVELNKTPPVSEEAVPMPETAPDSLSKWSALWSIIQRWSGNVLLYVSEKAPKPVSGQVPEYLSRVKELPKTHLGFAALGVLVLASLLAYVLSDDVSRPLPDCGDADVQEVARTLVMDAMTQPGGRAPDIEVADFQSGGSAPDAERQLCTFTVSDQGEKLAMYMSVSWKDADAAQYQVMIGSTYDAVSR